MAWTDIADSLFAPGAPARSADILALRDNVPALAGGADGAPKIQTAAIQDEAVTAGKLAFDAVQLRTANLGAGTVGSYALLLNVGTSGFNPGDLATGNVLRFTNAEGLDLGFAAEGFWRCMGYSAGSDIPSSAQRTTMWLRVS